MRKILYGILAVFMSLSLAYGSGFLIQMNINAASQTETEEEKEEETKVTAYGNWIDYRSGGVTGTGNYKDPFIIKTASELAQIMYWINNGLHNNASIKLENDINLSAHYWTPIGIGNQYFEGYFNGNGHKISGIYINSTNSSNDFKLNSDNIYTIGFFGQTKQAQLSNFKVSGNIRVSGVNGGAFLGAVLGAAYRNTILQNVYNDGLSITYENTNITSLNGIGGLVGGILDSSWLENCFNISGGINLDGSGLIIPSLFFVGGVAGFCSGSQLINCYNHASIYSYSMDGAVMGVYIGGLIGGNYHLDSSSGSSSISYCVSTGNITVYGGYSSHIGGLIGTSTDFLFIYDSFNYGNITVENISNRCVGGNIGYSSHYIEIRRSANFGNLTLHASSNAESTGFGGILGFGGEDQKTFIEDCANYGDVQASGSSNKYIGGIVGHIVNNGLINRCLNFGEVAGGNCVGGIAGEMGVDEVKGGFLGIGHVDAKTNVAITNSVNYGKARGNSNVGGIVGYMNGEKIYKCHYNNTFNSRGSGNGKGSSSLYPRAQSFLYSRSFFDTNSFWTSSSFIGFNYSGFKGKFTSEYNGQYISTISVSYPWVITHLVSNYYNSSKIAENYCLVPSRALGVANINLYYSHGNDEHVYQDTRNSIAKIEKYTYIESQGSCDWTTQDATYFHFLRGVSYTSNSRYKNLIRISLNDEQKKLFTSLNFDALKSGSSSQYEGISRYTETNIYYLGFKDNTIISNDYYNSYFQTKSIRAKLTSIKGDLPTTIRYYLGTSEITETINGENILGNLQINTVKSMPYYKGKIYFDLNPNIGYALNAIYSSPPNAHGFNQNRLYENVENRGDGYSLKKKSGMIKDAYYVYNYEQTLYVSFDSLEFNPTIYNTEKVNSNLEIKNTVTNISMYKDRIITIRQGYENAFIKDNWLKYGYEYSFYIIKSTSGLLQGDTLTFNENFKKVNDIPYEGTYISINTNDIISKGAAENILTNNPDENKDEIVKFCLILVAEKITNYQIVLHNMANTHDSLDDYTEMSNVSSNGFGGYSDFTKFDSTLNKSTQEDDERITTVVLSNLNIDESLTFDINISPHLYYKYIGSYFSGEEKNKKILQENGDKIEYKYENLTLISWFNLFSSTEFSEIDGNEVYNHQLIDGDHVIDIYSYYDVRNYVVNSSDNGYDNSHIFLDGVLYNGSELNVTLETDENSISLEERKFTNCYVSYFSKVTLHANEINGYKFIGFFDLNGSCYSINNNYEFTLGSINDINEYTKDQFTKSVRIVAKYASYSQVEASYNIVNNKSTYTITSPNDLVWLSNQVEKGETFENCTFVLANDISMSGIKFNPIGSKGIKVLNKKGEEVIPYFAGVFDGNNHIISNLTLCGDIGSDYYSTLNFRGLFGYTNGATIKNLTISDSNFSGYSYVGSVVGYAENTVVENVHNYNCQIITNSMPFYSVYIENFSNNTHKILTEDEIKTGKLISDELFSMRAENIDYVKRNFFGGIAGYATGSVFRGISNRADVGVSGGLNVEVANNISGLVGFANGNFKIEQSFFEGKVSGAGSVNNIAGGEASKIENCYYKGSTLIVYNATTINPSSTINEEILSSGYYNNNLEVTLPDKTIKTLDSSIWLIVNGKLTLRYFYWS